MKSIRRIGRQFYWHLYRRSQWRYDSPHCLPDLHRLDYYIETGDLPAS